MTSGHLVIIGPSANRSHRNTEFPLPCGKSGFKLFNTFLTYYMTKRTVTKHTNINGWSYLSAGSS